MGSLARVTPIALAAVVQLGCAGNPEPGEPGYPYNVAGAYGAEFDVQDQLYVGEIELTTGPGGAVEGEYTTESPSTVVGRLVGQVVGDRLSIAGPYSVREAGCDGMLDGAGTVAEGGDRIVGEFTTTGGCGDLSGTFVFER